MAPFQLAIPAPRYIALTAGLVFSTILTTYALCVHQDHCAVFLPMISWTWEYPPGTYLSRIAVGIGTDCLAVTQLFIYWINEAGTSAKALAGGAVGHSCAPCSCASNKFLLFSGLLACFALSWVGAICDSSDEPTCEGSVELHDLSAYVFFGAYDIVIATLHFAPRAVAAPGRAHLWADRALLGAMAVAKLRIHSVRALVGLGSYPWGQNWMAIAEWTDVVCAVLWTVKYVHAHGQSLTWITPVDKTANSPYALVRKDSGDKMLQFDHASTGSGTGTGSGGDAILTCLDARTLGWSASFVLCATLVCAGLADTRHGTAVGFPSISEAWAVKPGNWIARWGAVHGGHLVFQTSLFTSAARAATSGANAALERLRFALSTAAVACLLVAGVVDVGENAAVHNAAGAACLACFDLYVVLASVDHFFSGRRGGKGPGARLAVVVGEAAVACAALPYLVALEPGAATAVQWAHAVLLSVYVGAACQLYPATADMAAAVCDTDGAVQGRTESDNHYHAVV